MTPKLPFFKTLPPEIGTKIYKHAVLPKDTKREKRIFKTVTSDSTINPVDSVQHFFVYEIPDGYENMVITEGIMGVPELADDVLSLILPQILFKFNSEYTLSMFASTIAAHANKKLWKCPGLNVEINLTDMMSELCWYFFGWEPMDQFYLPHGKFARICHAVNRIDPRTWVLGLKQLQSSQGQRPFTLLSHMCGEISNPSVASAGNIRYLSERSNSSSHRLSVRVKTTTFLFSRLSQL